MEDQERPLLVVPPPGKRSRVERIYGEPADRERPRLDAHSLAALSSILGSSEEPVDPTLRTALEAALGDHLALPSSSERTAPGRLARPSEPPTAALEPAPALARMLEPPPESEPEVRPEAKPEPEARKEAKPEPEARKEAQPEPAARKEAQPEPERPRAEKPERPIAMRERPADLAPPDLAVDPAPTPAGPVTPTRVEARPTRARANPGLFAFFGEVQLDGEHAEPELAPVDRDREAEDVLEEIPPELQLPPGETPEEKKAAIEAAKQRKQAAIAQTTDGRAQKAGAKAVEDQAAVQRAGQKKAAGRALQGKTATGEAEEAGRFKKLEKSNSLAELKEKLKQRMEGEKTRLSLQLKTDERELGNKLDTERQRVQDEAKDQQKKLGERIAAKEKEIATRIKKKGEDAKKRAETDRKNAKRHTETDKKRATDHAASEARRVEQEANRRAGEARARGEQDEASRIVANGKQSAAEARQKGEEAVTKLDDKLVETLGNIAKSDQEGMARLEDEKQKMLDDAHEKAKGAEEEAKKKVTTALLKINEQEKTGIEKLRAANDTARKESLKKFDTQMALIDKGKESDLAKLEEDTNKVCAEIDQEVRRYGAQVVEETAKAKAAATRVAEEEIAGIRAEGEKAASGIDRVAEETAARIDAQAAANEEKSKKAAADGMASMAETSRALTAEITAAADRSIAGLEQTAEEKQAAREEEERRKQEAEAAERDKVKEAEEAEAAKKREAEQAESKKKEEEQKGNEAAAQTIVDELGSLINVGETRVLNCLRGKTPEQIAAIRAAFKAKTGKDLDAALAESGAFDKDELDEAKAHLSGDPVEKAVAVLKNGAAGWTSKEDRDRMQATLAGLDPETRKKVAAEYERQTGDRLTTMLKSDVDEETAALYALADEKERKTYQGADAKVDTQAVSSAVSQIRGATTGKLFTTDEKAIREALKGKTPAEIQAIKDLWRAQHGGSLDDILEKELSGTELIEAKALMSDDPAWKAVATLQNAGDGAGTDVPTMQATLEEIKDPILRDQVAKEFEKQTGKSLESMIKSELSGRERDKALAAAEGKFDTVAAITVEEKTKGSVLGDLSDGMADSVGVDRESMKVVTDVATVAALGPVGLAWVAADHVDLSDDENGVYAALETAKTPEERAALERAYNERNKPNTLRGDLNSQLDGAEKDVANALLDGKKAKAEAAKMKAAAEGVGGAIGVVDRQEVFGALERCESKEERDALIAEYNKNYGKAAGGTDFDAMVKAGMSDLDERKAQQLAKNGKMDDATAYYYAQNEGYFFGYGPGWGTDHGAMQKIAKGKSAEDLKKLNDDYKVVAAEFGDKDADLFKDTADETSGREGKELEIALRGEPKTLAEARARQKEMADFERNDVGGTFGEIAMFVVLGPVVYGAAKVAGISSGDVVRAATDVWSPEAAKDLSESQKRLETKAAELEKTMKPAPGESAEAFEKRKVEAFKVECAKEAGYLKNYQEAKDDCADAASTAVGLVVTGAMAIATGGAAAPLCALVGGLAGITTKAAILGGAYANEDLAMDLANVAAEVVAAGVVKWSALDDAVKGLKTLAPDKLVARVLKEALSEALENGTSTFLMALLDKHNFKDLASFAKGVLGGPALAAFSGAVAAGVTVTLGDIWDLSMGQPNGKLAGFMKGAVTEGMGGLGAAAVNPGTWSGTPEEIVGRFGRGFIDNILSAGAEGIGDHIGAGKRNKAAASTRQQLAATGVSNTTVVGGNVLDLDTGNVYDGESGGAIGTIDIDPDTGMIYDVSTPGAPQPIGINPHLKGTHVGRMDADKAAAPTPESPAEPSPDSEPTTEMDVAPDTERSEMDFGPDVEAETIPDTTKASPEDKIYTSEPSIHGGVTAIDPSLRTDGGPTHEFAGQAFDGKHFWSFGADVTEADGVVKFTYRVYLNVNLEGDPTPRVAATVSAAELDRFRANVQAGVQRHYNQPGYQIRGPSGELGTMQVNVEFTTDREEAHQVVNLMPGDGNATLSQWFVDGDPTTHAHEIGHGIFGLLDEYADKTIPNRPVHHGSLMGDYWIQDKDGKQIASPKAGLEKRHLDQISKLLGGATEVDDEMADKSSHESDEAPASPVSFEVELEKAKSQTPSERALALGLDPKRGFIAHEAEVGTLIEWAYGYFMRDPSGDAEWIALSDEFQGQSFDLIGVPADKVGFQTADMAQFNKSVTKHFLKSVDWVVLDLRYLSAAQVKAVTEYIDKNHAGDKSRRIVLR